MWEATARICDKGRDGPLGERVRAVVEATHEPPRVREDGLGGGHRLVAEPLVRVVFVQVGLKRPVRRRQGPGLPALAQPLQALHADPSRVVLLLLLHRG